MSIIDIIRRRLASPRPSAVDESRRCAVCRRSRRPDLAVVPVAAAVVLHLAAALASATLTVQLLRAATEPTCSTSRSPSSR